MNLQIQQFPLEDVYVQVIGSIQTGRTYLIAVLALIVAWRWAKIGAILYIALAALYLMMSHGESFVLSIPHLLLGVLFLEQWILRAELER